MSENCFEIFSNNLLLFSYFYLSYRYRQYPDPIKKRTGTGSATQREKNEKECKFSTGNMWAKKKYKNVVFQLFMLVMFCCGRGQWIANFCTNWFITPMQCIVKESPWLHQ